MCGGCGQKDVLFESQPPSSNVNVVKWIKDIYGISVWNGQITTEKKKLHFKFFDQLLNDIS